MIPALLDRVMCMTIYGIVISYSVTGVCCYSLETIRDWFDYWGATKVFACACTPHPAILLSTTACVVLLHHDSDDLLLNPTECKMKNCCRCV
ncbi:hypothetical protein BDN72DRAFT_206281 [Pluteus cervinus]|uniref:Uncharacterized protein n=1 Tax=Pluteus cervinus TaxID=181527 RepID=A0ACD3AK71_9AGAR|nr:hypothetical protein BDN72DRAFT_206281 [Pluteus cervinus]